MKTVSAITKRNIKLFFKDKGMFFTALITPAILLVLYSTFLGKVYKDAFVSSLPENFSVSMNIIDGLVGAELISSILSVSCVTVAFCSNFLMVQDKANGTVRDLLISPVSSYALSVGYYAASFISTIIIAFSAAALSLIYIAFVGWFMSAVDVLLLFLDMILLVMLGTALSSVINFFLSTQGQISAVGTVVSSGYGFISGAYMPISSFDETLRNIISFFPGTYGTSLLRNHCMRGGFLEMERSGIPNDVIEAVRDSVDCNLYFFENQVPSYAMYLILISSSVILLLIYIILNKFAKKQK